MVSLGCTVRVSSSGSEEKNPDRNPNPYPHVKPATSSPLRRASCSSLQLYSIRPGSVCTESLTVCWRPDPVHWCIFKARRVLVAYACLIRRCGRRSWQRCRSPGPCAAPASAAAARRPPHDTCTKDSSKGPMQATTPLAEQTLLETRSAIGTREHLGGLAANRTSNAGGHSQPVSCL